MKIIPSILDCDFRFLHDEIKKVEKTGIDMLHIDVMDGCFVPNISFGFPIINAVKRATELPLDIHLMIEKPMMYVDRFLTYQPKYLTFHVEVTENIQEIIQRIKQSSTKVGLALKPSTPLESILPFLEDVDLLLFMTVEPGFGGQSLDTHVLKNIEVVKQWKIERGLNHLVFQVDGGINDQSILHIKKDLIDLAVAGTFIFKGNDYEEQIRKLTM